MENAKKMIIVSPDVLQRIQNTQLSLSPISSSSQSSSSVGKVAGDTVSELDREMTRLLNNKSLGDQDKWEQYQQVLQRYLHFATQKRKPIQLPVVEMDVNDDRQTNSVLGNEQIVETFTKNYKKDARNFLKFLDGKKDLISWDDDGVVYIHREKIPHSNIIDLLHDVIRVRKSIQPPGWEQLLQILKEINIPNEFVTNPLGRDYLMRLKGDINGRSSISVKGESPSPAAARRHLDFQTPRAASLVKKAVVAGRADDTYPLSSNSINPEYNRQSKSVKTPVWEKFKL